jgi:hypothetical protein
MNGSARMKLNDLSYIHEAYEDLISGKYQDGEAEFGAAILRARDASFLTGCDVWFFGFDMVPPTLHDLMAAVAAVSPRCGVFLPLENDENARDFDSFLPMQKALERLVFAARRMQAQAERIEIEEDDTIRPWATKRVYPAEPFRSVKHLPKDPSCVFGFCELPAIRKSWSPDPYLRVVVTPFNCFGAAGKPLMLRYSPEK